MRNILNEIHTQTKNKRIIERNIGADDIFAFAVEMNDALIHTQTCENTNEQIYLR
jgi:hypothetical protein